MKINKQWHLKHKMPQKPTIEQRIKWHIEHAKNCGCRRIEGKIAEEMKEKGIPIPIYKFQNKKNTE